MSETPRKKAASLPPPPGEEPRTELILCQAEDGKTKIEVRLLDDTVWPWLNQMAHLFQRYKSVISKRIKNVFGEDELKEASVVAKFATTASDGKTYQVCRHIHLCDATGFPARIPAQELAAPRLVAAPPGAQAARLEAQPPGRHKRPWNYRSRPIAPSFIPLGRQWPTSRKWQGRSPSPSRPKSSKALTKAN